MNRKRRSSARPQQTFYQYLEDLRSLEMHERSHQHASNPFLEAELESSGGGNNTTATDYRVSTSRPRMVGAGTWLIIATSLSALIASLTFLSWLWFVDRKNESWRYLVLTGRATQSITLMCVFIRWSIGSLAAITTSMAASISAEFHGIPKRSVAEVSIARFTNNGPQSFKKLLPGTALRGWIKVCMAILFILVAASQLFSQPFLAWLHNPDALASEDPLGETDDEWSRAPMQSPIFAEYLEPGQLKDNIDDTG
ncbi:Ff.00g128910.m01.CDS01 [Fusarium sp. VM40]|nr:Ff.00g128910.m01.CDS01 [Fusarium sp. VM40]